MDDKLSSRPTGAADRRDAIPDRDLRRRRAICITVLVLQGAWALIGLGLIPSLIGRDPVLLELLRGSIQAVGSASLHH